MVCPSNVNQPSILWDIESVIKTLENDEPELHKKLKDSFSRWHSNWSPVYIKKDPQRPELEGTIKFFKFSAQINNVINGQINPEESELVETAPSVNPYHLLNGKDFLCVVGKKTKIFRDWTKCKFMDEITPFVFKIGDKQVVTENSEKSVKLVQEFLKKNTPTLDDYLHKDWTNDQFEKVAENIVTLIQPRPVLDMVLERTKDIKMKEAILSKLAGKTSTSNTVNTSSLIDEPVSFESNETPLEPVSEKVDNTTNIEKDEYDSLFEDL